MPGRNIPLVTNQIYHVLNRGVASQPIFFGKRDYQRAIEIIRYYQNKNLNLKYSHFVNLSTEIKREIIKGFLNKKQFLVRLIAYCLMPNHIHFILQQLTEGGISKFMSNLQNSYSRYFNLKNKRSGHLFQGRFKAVMVETDEQLLHLSRYIHLNPYSSYVIKTLDGLKEYPYSSFLEFIGTSKIQLCKKEIILNHFQDKKDYEKFVFDQADYQRSLEIIKHALLEK